MRTRREPLNAVTGDREDTPTTLRANCFGPANTCSASQCLGTNVRSVEFDAVYEVHILKSRPWERVAEWVRSRAEDLPTSIPSCWPSRLKSSVKIVASWLAREIAT